MKKKLHKQTKTYAKATRVVARNHPSTRLDPKKKSLDVRNTSALDRRDFERWKAGTSIAELARERGVKRRFIVHPFRKLAGGKEKYKALRAEGAGGKAFGGKRGERRTKEAVQQDDSKVKVVTSGKHWRMEPVYEPIVVKVKLANDKGTMLMPWRKEVLRVFISPKGNKYVQAAAMEKADLIVRVKATSLPDKDGVTYPLPACDSLVRMRKLETSGALKKLKREETVVTRGLKARAAKKKQKAKKAKHLAKLAKK